jgi:hypothetical protein
MRGELLQPKWMVKNMLKEPWLHEYEEHKIRQREKQKQERANKKSMLSEMRGRSGSTGGKKSRGNAHVPTPKKTTKENPCRKAADNVRPGPAKRALRRAKISSAAKIADLQSSAHHDTSPPAKRMKESGKCCDHSTQSKGALKIKLTETGNALAGMFVQPNRKEIYLHVTVRVQYGECRQALHTPSEALERTLRSERISEDVVSTDNELGQPR